MSDLKALRVAVESLADGGPELDLSDLGALRVCVHTCIGILAAPRIHWCKTHESSSTFSQRCRYRKPFSECDMVPAVMLEVSE